MRIELQADCYAGIILASMNNVSFDQDEVQTMINAANSSGALGCKINGSGGGGCMFAFAPENPERVAKAIESVGGKSYIVYADEGTNALI